MLVLGETIHQSDGDKAYYSLYETEKVTLDKQGNLSADYHGKSLYVVDKQGNPLSAAISYTMKDGKYQIPVQFFNEEENKHTYTIMECSLAKDKKSLVVETYYVYDEETKSYTNRMDIRLSDYKNATLSRNLRMPVKDKKQWKAFSEWKKHKGLYEAWKIGQDNFQKGWNLRFIEEQLSGEERYVLFQITDTQSNCYSSEMIKVENQNRKTFSINPGQIKTDEYDVSVKGALNQSKIEGNVTVNLNVHNKAKKTLIYAMDDESVLLNHSRVALSGYTAYEKSEMKIKSGDTNARRLVIPAGDFCDLKTLNTLSCVMIIKEPESYKEIGRVTLEFKMDVDISQLGNVSQTVQASQMVDDILYELINVKENKSGGFDGVIHCKNQSSTPKRLVFNKVAVNQYVVPLEKIVCMNLPAKTEGYTTFTLKNQLYYQTDTYLLGRNKKILEKNLLGSWGVKQVDLFTFYPEFKEKTQRQVTLNLKNKIKYQKSERQENSDKKVIFQKDGLQVMMKEMRRKNEELILELEMINQGECDYNLDFASWDTDILVNGKKTNGTSMTDFDSCEIPANTTTSHYLKIKVPEEEDSAKKITTDISVPLYQKKKNAITNELVSLQVK